MCLSDAVTAWLALRHHSHYHGRCLPILLAYSYACHHRNSINCWHLPAVGEGIWDTAGGVHTCVLGLCVHQHECALCKVVKWIYGCQALLQALEKAQSKIKESRLTRNLQSIGESYERRQLLLIKMERQREGTSN